MGFDLRRQFHWHRRNLDRQLSYLARRRQRHDQRTTAYLWYVSPTQINLQVPNITAVGPVTVVVTGPNGTVSSTVTLAQFAPAFNLLDAKHVAGIILRSNGSGAYGGGSDDVIGPTASSLGYATVAAKAGDIVELFGVGFGPTSISFQ
jgi:uncharacterized protein (TIGR03437 family)